MDTHGDNYIQFVNLATWQSFGSHLEFVLVFQSRVKEAIMVKVALFVRLQAKPGREADVSNFLQQGLALANQEATTPVWFALRLGPSTFGIFDAFDDEAGRSAHLAGPIASALMANAADLLAESPRIEHVDVLGVKLPQ
jgi:quinol monooxygenase YgiN